MVEWFSRYSRYLLSVRRSLYTKFYGRLDATFVQKVSAKMCDISHVKWLLETMKVSKAAVIIGNFDLLLTQVLTQRTRPYDNQLARK